MKLNFTNKEGKKVMEIDSSKEKDITVLSESLKELADKEEVEDKIEEGESEDD